VEPGVAELVGGPAKWAGIGGVGCAREEQVG